MRQRRRRRILIGGVPANATFAAVSPRRPVAGCACCSMRPINKNQRGPTLLWAHRRRFIKQHQLLEEIFFSSLFFFFKSKPPPELNVNEGSAPQDAETRPGRPLRLLTFTSWRKRIRAGPDSCSQPRRVKSTSCVNKLRRRPRASVVSQSAVKFPSVTLAEDRWLSHGGKPQRRSFSALLSSSSRCDFGRVLFLSKSSK